MDIFSDYGIDAEGMDEVSLQALEFIDLRGDYKPDAVKEAEFKAIQVEEIFEEMEQTSAVARKQMVSLQAIAPEDWQLLMPLNSFTEKPSMVNLTESFQGIFDLSGKMIAGIIIALLGAIAGLITLVRRLMDGAAGRSERVSNGSKEVKINKRKMNDAYYQLDQDARYRMSVELKRREEQFFATIRRGATPFYVEVISKSSNLDTVLNKINDSLKVLDSKKLGALLTKLTVTWSEYFKADEREWQVIPAAPDKIRTFFEKPRREIGSIVKEIENYRMEVGGKNDANRQKLADILKVSAGKNGNYNAIVEQVKNERQNSDPNLILATIAKQRRDNQLFIEPADVSRELDSLQKTSEGITKEIEGLNSLVNKLKSKVDNIQSKPTGKDKKILQLVDQQKKAITNMVRTGIRYVNEMIAENAGVSKLLMFVLEELDRNMIASREEIDERLKMIKAAGHNSSQQAYSDDIDLQIDEVNSSLQTLQEMIDLHCIDDSHQAFVDDNVAKVQVINDIMVSMQANGHLTVAELAALQAVEPDAIDEEWSDLLTGDLSDDEIAVSQQAGGAVIIKIIIAIITAIIVGLIRFFTSMADSASSASSAAKFNSGIRFTFTTTSSTPSAWTIYQKNKTALDAIYQGVMDSYFLRFYFGEGVRLNRDHNTIREFLLKQIKRYRMSGTMSTVVTQMKKLNENFNRVTSNSPIEMLAELENLNQQVTRIVTEMESIDYKMIDMSNLPSGPVSDFFNALKAYGATDDPKTFDKAFRQARQDKPADTFARIVNKTEFDAKPDGLLYGILRVTDTRLSEEYLDETKKANELSQAARDEMINLKQSGETLIKRLRGAIGAKELDVNESRALKQKLQELSQFLQRINKTQLAVAATAASGFDLMTGIILADSSYRLAATKEKRYFK